VTTTNAKPLTNEEIAVLVALWEACGGSIHAHVPEQAVLSHFPSHFIPFDTSKEPWNITKLRIS